MIDWKDENEMVVDDGTHLERSDTVVEARKRDVGLAALHCGQRFVASRLHNGQRKLRINPLCRPHQPRHDVEHRGVDRADGHDVGAALTRVGDRLLQPLI